MELLLNILWLLLALPAFAVWRRAASSDARPQHSQLRSLFLLSCMLMLLFPVVSASDDLHPVCAEIEESGPSKRVVKHITSAGTAAWSMTGALPASPAGMGQLRYEICGSVPEDRSVIPQEIPAHALGCRAPPAPRA
jgi:hypothetical protein